MISERLLNKIKETVNNKNGIIIDNLLECYKNNYNKFLVECKFGHQWKISWSNLQNNRWCPTCSKNKKLDLDYANNIAKRFDAELLSTEYKNSSSKLLWRCKNNHEFELSINAINSKGHWCQYCSCWSSEEICRRYFETIFNEKFIKIRPDWLLNSKGNRMELDGYCAKLMLAFEHHGEQHYFETNFFQTNLVDRLKADAIKRKLCEDHNIKLIEIPQLFRITKISDLKSLIKNNYDNLPENFDNVAVDFDDIYTDNSKHKEIKLIIEQKGGKLLSNNYVNAHIKLDIICNNNHNFHSSANAIKSGQWCPYCSNHVKLTIEDMKQLAINKNGICLSDKYINAKTKLLWKCNICNNEWLAVPYSIKSGCWCPKCGLEKCFRNRKRKV